MFGDLGAAKAAWAERQRISKSVREVMARANRNVEPAPRFHALFCFRDPKRRQPMVPSNPFRVASRRRSDLSAGWSISIKDVAALRVAQPRSENAGRFEVRRFVSLRFVVPHSHETVSKDRFVRPRAAFSLEAAATQGAAIGNRRQNLPREREESEVSRSVCDRRHEHPTSAAIAEKGRRLPIAAPWLSQLSLF